MSTNQPTARRILVTTALPYAADSLHLGHLVEHVQSNIWVRFQQLRGHECWHVCGSDAHGTPIMLRAQKLGISPEQLVADLREEHIRDLKAFAIDFDNFYTTHSEENKTLASFIYTQLQARGDINTQTIQQAFDPKENIFLPDRYVKGECPKCGAADQYGDSCEVCGATYSPTELKNPLSVLSGVAPILKSTEHYFFKLENYSEALQNWTHQDHLQPAIRNKLNEWFEAGLKQWDITRDAPYFGFPIPGTTDKFFYVWLDAPIGYMASFKNLCDTSPNTPGLVFDEYWGQNAKTQYNTELYHFIGKDIVYFHALFWPALLMGAGFRTPDAIFAHGFLTADGQKMSKSRGTFIKIRTYINHINPEYLRYYYAAKLGPNLDDIDLNFQDFVQRVNADLVNKYVNIASRTASIISKNFNNQLSSTLDNPALFDRFSQQSEIIAQLFEQREFSQAMRHIMTLCDEANQYIDAQKPWALLKNPDTHEQAQSVCTLGLNLFRILSIYLQPVLPLLCEKIADLFKAGPLIWDNLFQPLVNHQINPFTPLLTRLDSKQVEAMIEETKAENAPAPIVESRIDPLADTIDFDAFAKIDLRVGKIIKAEALPEADKLLKLIIDIGEDKPRQIFAGIKSAYDPEQLTGKLTVIVANLAPRKMRFGLSEGMVLAAKGPHKSGLWILEPHEGAEPGMRIM